MRIAMLGYEFPPHSLGGLGTHTYGLLSELKKVCDVTLFLPFRTKCKGIKIRHVKMSDKHVNQISTGYNIDVVKKYNQKIAEMNFSNFDIVHCHDWITAKAGAEIRKNQRIPLVHTVHSTQLGKEIYLGADKEKCKLENQGFENADTIIAVSNKTKQEVKKLYNIKNKVKTVYNGININEFKKGKETKTILFIGRLSKRKGMDYLLKASPSIILKFPDYKIVFIGEGKMMKNMKKLSKKLGIENKTVFRGFLSQTKMVNEYSKCDVVALPSIYEPFGLTVLEAMASAKPVITTNISGVSEIITNWENGIIVKAGTVKPLSKAIEKLLSDNKLREKIGNNGFKLAKKYNWNKAAKETFKIYKELI